jgi:D-glycero-alpha-D-manno-heptose 1-phosphate guanylyltransferase
VEEWLQISPHPWTWKTSLEPEPLGTGGALRLAAQMIPDEKFLAFNGDTFLEVSCADLISCHDAKHSPVTLAAVEVPDTAAFGRIKVVDGHVIEFHEKGLAGPGLINGGAYVIDKAFALSWPTGPLSLERDILARPVLAPTAHLTSGRFLDIGTPENLALAGEMAVALN